MASIDPQIDAAVALYYDNGLGNCFNWCGGDFESVACYVEGSCRGYTADELSLLPGGEHE